MLFILTRSCKKRCFYACSEYRLFSQRTYSDMQDVCHFNMYVVKTVYSSDDICGLAEACGAMTIQESSMFTFDPSKVQVIIVENNAAANMAELQSKTPRH